MKLKMVFRRTIDKSFIIINNQKFVLHKQCKLNLNKKKLKLELFLPFLSQAMGPVGSKKNFDL